MTTRHRKEMNKVNPKTQEAIVVPAQKVVKVTISKALKEAVKNS
jgi:nucleoid DNA-binding protein